MQEPNAVPAITPTPEPPARKGMGCFWKFLLIAGGTLLVIILAIVWQVLSVKSWLEDNMESSPAVLPAPELSQDEQSGVEDLYRNYQQHYEEKKDLDVMLTPAQFNTMVAENIAKEKARGSRTDLEALQISFEGPQTVFRGTTPVPDRQGLYYNFEIRGSLAIENGKVDYRMDTVRLRGQDAPFSARSIMEEALSRGLGEQERRFAAGQDSIFQRVKLLRREGDRIHIVLNGEHLEKPKE